MYVCMYVCMYVWQDLLFIGSVPNCSKFQGFIQQSLLQICTQSWTLVTDMLLPFETTAAQKLLVPSKLEYKSRTLWSPLGNLGFEWRSMSNNWAGFGGTHMGGVNCTKL